MRARVFLLLLAVIAPGAFIIGRYVLAPAHAAAPPTEPRSAAQAAAAIDRDAPASLLDRGPSPRTVAPPRFTPPPIPNDPGLAGWLASGSPEPTPEMIAGKNKDISARLDELFGADFPAEKRQKVLAAQESAMRSSAQFTWDYYHGAISNDDFASQLHQTVLSYSHEIEGALDRDQYRAFMGVEVGTDPYTAITTPGMRPGDPVTSSPP